MYRYIHIILIKYSSFLLNDFHSLSCVYVRARVRVCIQCAFDNNLAKSNRFNLTKKKTVFFLPSNNLNGFKLKNQQQHCIRVNDFHIELIQKAMNSDCLLFPIKKNSNNNNTTQRAKKREKEKMHRIGERLKNVHTRTHTLIHTNQFEFDV